MGSILPRLAGRGQSPGAPGAGTGAAFCLTAKGYGWWKKGGRRLVLARSDPAFGFGVIPFVGRGSGAAPLRAGGVPDRGAGGSAGWQHHGPGVAVGKALLLSGPKKPCKALSCVAPLPPCRGDRQPWAAQGEILRHRSCDSASQVLFNYLGFFGWFIRPSYQHGGKALLMA